MSICVSADALEKSLVNLPKSFCFKVVIPETNRPLGPPAEPMEKPPLDQVSKAIIERYITPETLITVLDTTEPTLTSAQFIRECAQALIRSENSIKLVVFTVGHKLVPDNWTTGGLPNLDVTLLQYVDPNDILIILAHSNPAGHILTGNLIGWWGAVLSGSKNVICPDPWSPGVSISIPESWKRIKCGWTHTKYFDQAYYINLDRRPDRCQHMEEQLKRFGFKASRVPAIDGKEIPWKPDYGLISNYWNHGAFAYCLSYRLVIIDAMRKGYENILVMDDDCVFQDNLWEVLDKAWSELPEEWHMLYFAANHGPSPENVPTENDRQGDHLYRLKGSMGSHAIIINKHCFKTILSYLSSPYAPLDMFFSLYQKFFPCYITYPGLASQLAGVSDIINKDVNYTKDWGIDYINYIPSRAKEL
jgi:GR25 family glycosyltransferase involved in LPS biosynthesis